MRVASLLLLLFLSSCLINTTSAIQTRTQTRQALTKPDPANETENLLETRAQTAAELEPLTTAALVVISLVVVTDVIDTFLKVRLIKLARRLRHAMDVTLSSHLAPLRRLFEELEADMEALGTKTNELLVHLREQGAFGEGEEARSLSASQWRDDVGKVKRKLHEDVDSAKVGEATDLENDPDRQLDPDQTNNLVEAIEGVLLISKEQGMTKEAGVTPRELALNSAYTLLNKAYTLANVATSGAVTAAVKNLVQESATTAASNAMSSLISGVVSLLQGFYKIYSTHAEMRLMREFTAHKLPELVLDAKFATCDIAASVAYMNAMQAQGLRTLLEHVPKEELRRGPAVDAVFAALRRVGDKVHAFLDAPKATPEEVSAATKEIDGLKLKGKMKAIFRVAVQATGTRRTCANLRPKSQAEVEANKPLQNAYAYHDKVIAARPVPRMFALVNKDFEEVSQELLPEKLRMSEFHLFMSKKPSPGPQGRLVDTVNVYTGSFSAVLPRIKKHKLDTTGFMDHRQYSTIWREEISGQSILRLIPTLYMKNKGGNSYEVRGEMQPAFTRLPSVPKLGTALYLAVVRGGGARITSCYYAERDHEVPDGKHCFRTQHSPFLKGLVKSVTTAFSGKAYMWCCKQNRLIVADGDDIPHTELHPLHLNFDADARRALYDVSSASPSVAKPNKPRQVLSPE